MKSEIVNEINLRINDYVTFFYWIIGSLTGAFSLVTGWLIVQVVRLKASFGKLDLLMKSIEGIKETIENLQKEFHGFVEQEGEKEKSILKNQIEELKKQLENKDKTQRP